MRRTKAKPARRILWSGPRKGAGCFLRHDQWQPPHETLTRSLRVCDKATAGAAESRYKDVQWLLAALARELVERDRAGRCDVERFDSARLWDRGALLATLEYLGRQSLPLGTEHEHHLAPRIQLGERDSATRHEGDPPPLGLVESAQRHAKERPHRGAHRLRPGRIGAAIGQRHPCAECVRRAQQRANVAGISDPPERQRDRPRPAWQVVAPEDSNDAGRMRERRHLGQQLRFDIRPRDEHVRRFDRGREPCLEQILPLDREQPELVAPAPVMEFADELEPLVVAGCDQAPAPPEAARSFGRAAAASAPSLPAASAAFACSAIAPNAAGSLTARSASTFRSSSIPAFGQPCTNWLYERPFARAAALIRVIQSFRNSRFRTFRSR